MKKSFILFVLSSITASMSSLVAQDYTQLALDIADAREESTEQLMNYSWQRTTKIYLNEEEKNHSVVKVWFNGEGKMEGSSDGGIENLEETIGVDLNSMYEQIFESVVNYVFLSEEDWIELMDQATIISEDDVIKIEVNDLLVKNDKIDIIIDNNTKLFKSLVFSYSVKDIPVRGTMVFETMPDGTNYPKNSEIFIHQESMKITAEIIAHEIPETMKKQDKKDENKGSLTKALRPLVGNALISGQLFKAEAELTEADPDILAEYDVKIPISEGFNLTANIYRSKNAAANGEKVPVVM